MRFILSHITLLKNLFRFALISKHQAFFKIALILKENEILKRSLDIQGKRPRFTNVDRHFYLLALQRHPRLIRFVRLVRPETILNAWKKRLKKHWTYHPETRSPGRPSITKAVRELILHIKRTNPHWGITRIGGELKMLNIDISRETVRRTIHMGRRDGGIQPTGEWKRFLKSHWDSLFVCDFLIVDTIGFVRFYVFFIQELKNRKIVQFGITRNPNRGFVRNQLLEFMYGREEKKTYLIHDNSGELKWFDYETLGITGISTVPYSPNMNAFAERFIGSLRRECLDHFLIFSQVHLRNIIVEYVHYHNELRPHQGIGNAVPGGSQEGTKGEIQSRPVLFGLNHHFYREVA